MPAVSGLAFTGTVGLCGFIRPNAIRKIPYAARTPNAIDPAAAPTNMTKFNKSVIIQLHSICTIFATRLMLSVRTTASYETIDGSDSRRKIEALTLVSVAK